MNEKRQILLFKALKNGGRITTSEANRLYSGNNGRDALISLQYQGYFEDKVDFGTFKINEDMLDQMPNEVVEKFRAWKKSQNKSSSEEKKGDHEKVAV